ncbi:MAG: DUF3343 domain-containing protein [Candidatus Aegiribacteria sp.]|nr:DUF3343 domain-containing protein [Candidatus Aegiribacteria sp.]
MTGAGYALLLLPSVSHALLSEKVVKAEGISCKLIPTPREISTDCGIVLRFLKEDKKRLENVIEENGIDFKRIVVIQ